MKNLTSRFALPSLVVSTLLFAAGCMTDAPSPEADAEPRLYYKLEYDCFCTADTQGLFWVTTDTMNRVLSVTRDSESGRVQITSNLERYSLDTLEARIALYESTADSSAITRNSPEGYLVDAYFDMKQGDGTAMVTDDEIRIRVMRVFPISIHVARP